MDMKLMIVLKKLIEEYLDLIKVLDKIIFKPLAKGYRMFSTTYKIWNKQCFE